MTAFSPSGPTSRKDQANLPPRTGRLSMAASTSTSFVGRVEMNFASPDRAQAFDRMYRNQRHIYDLTRCYFLFGRDRLIRGLDPPSSGNVLEIGCGTARNLIQAARRYPAAVFYGFDISTEM